VYIFGLPGPLDLDSFSSVDFLHFILHMPSFRSGL
jgi:hypothetical protein